ncbi:MAG: amidohydrolase family protein [Acidobacteria bacterium]|nr:amidohydrolase family protein [Acidobacteriota bacterium]
MFSPNRWFPILSAARATRRIVTLVAVLVLGTFIAAQSPAPATPPDASSVLITGARILDVVAGKYLAVGAVLIEKGRITSVTEGLPPNVPDAVRRLTLKDATLVPGLIDAHAWAAPTSDLDADYFYMLSLAHGVTTTRVVNVRTAWGVAQRGRSASGAIDAPALSTSGRGIDQAASPGRLLFDAPDAAAAADEAARQVASGVDWIAGYDNVTPDAYRAMVAALRGSRVRICAQPGASSMRDLVAARVHSIETLAYPTQARTGTPDETWLAASAKELATLAISLARAKITLVPMLAAGRARAYPKAAAKDASLQLLPAARRQAIVDALAKLPPAEVTRARKVWTSQLAFIRRFVRAGGRVAAGSGFELGGYPAPGVAVQREMAALVEAGLTPIQAIRAATINGALMLGRPAAQFGIKPGLDADFFIVAGDPLNNTADLARISSVIRGGRVFDASELLARSRVAMTK